MNEPTTTTLLLFAVLLSACSSSDAATPTTPFPEPVPDDCLTSVAPGNQKLNCEGLDFQVTVPESCTKSACGLIADVHGFGMNGDLMEVHTHMQEIAGAKGYIVFQPSAPGMIPTSAWSPANDDQVFALMQRIIKAWHVDPKRIHFDGYSMGGWMTWRFVCKHSDLLASAAPIAGGAQAAGGSCAFSDTEKPAQQIPILYTHGRNDGLVLFPTAQAQVDAVTKAWYPGVTPEVVAKDFDYEWDRYKNSDGTIFEFVQHDWACGFTFPVVLKGHCFPGSNQFLGCGRDTNGDFDGGIEYPFKWAETVLEFFVAHPRKN